MAAKFRKENYGEETIVRLSRKQIAQMAQMIENFKEVEDFQLHISHESGIGTSVRLTFNIDLTDVSKW